MIDVYLKVFQKSHENLQTIFSNLDYWLKVFAAPRYKITIYSENITLPEPYCKHKIVDRQFLINNFWICRKLEQRLNKNSFLSDKWKPAATALSFPYWFCEEELIWNIDASDLRGGIFESKYLEAVEDYFNREQLSTLNQDIYYLPNHQFSFGVHLGRKLEMKKIIETVIARPIKDRGWGINLDAMISQYIFSKEYDKSVFCFTTPEYLCHEGDIGKGLCSRWNAEQRMMETDFYGRKKQFGQLKSGCLLFT